MREKLIKTRDYLGPYDYRAGFIYFTILIFNLSNLRSFTFDYEYGWDRVNFFLIGLLTYALSELPLYFGLKLLQVFWRNRKKTFALYLLELWVGSLIPLLVVKVGERYLIPLLEVDNFLVSGGFCRRGNYAIFLRNCIRSYHTQSSAKSWI
jgi:hypothetical protein